MLGRRLDKLVSIQHEEVMACLQGRDEELREEFRVRREESKRRDEKFEQHKEEARQREEKLDRLVEETREFNREILLRNEKVYKGVLIRLEEMGEETRASTAQIKSNTEETRAQTQALLRLIDRFDERGDAAAA